jgi:hypothetical protein
VPPVFHSPTLLWPTLSSSCRDIAFSQSRDPRAQILGPFLTRSRYTIPRADPTVLLRSGSNGCPSLATRDLATWSTKCLGSQPANSRVREISRSLATCPPQMDGYNPLSLLRRFASSRLATLNTQYLGFHPVNSRVREISRSLPPVLLRWTATNLSLLRHSRN